ncbi:hypothetical protein V2J09_009333 [Rumex salicifolius]
MQRMNSENGLDGGVSSSSIEAATNEIGFPQNNPSLNDNLEESSELTQHQLHNCNLNFLNLLDMKSSSNYGSALAASPSGSAVYEPLQLHLNPTPQQSKNFVTERQRRQTFNDKFTHLRSLLPNPNKNDRASIVGDAIEYINELTRTVKELKILVEKKRCLKQRIKRCKLTTITEVDNVGPAVKSEEQLDQSLRSSWLQRKCKDTEIDVRIVDDEVTIRVVQGKKMFNLLLYVSRTFDELQLDLHHVTGGHVGDYCTFLFNTKIAEGSSLYASAIANRLIDVVDRQYAAFH